MQGNVQLQILNALGQQVYAEEFAAQATRYVDATPFPPGVYTLRLCWEGQHRSTLFMISGEK
jgi:hypothetical protein